VRKSEFGCCGSATKVHVLLSSSIYFLSIYLIDATVALASTSTDWGRHRRVQAAALVCRQGECEAVYSFSSSVLQRAILPMNDT